MSIHLKFDRFGNRKIDLTFVRKTASATLFISASLFFIGAGESSVDRGS